MRRICTVAAALGIGLALPAAAHAATFTVDRTSDDPADGDCSVAGGPCTLRAAVERANDAAGADRIELGGRTVVLTGGELTSTDDLTIANGVIDGDGGQIIRARADLVLDGVTLTGAGDGAISSDGERLEILSSRIAGNEGPETIVQFAPEEGDGTVTVERSTFSGNAIGRERDGGGVLDVQPEGNGGDTTTVRIADSAFLDNTSGSGGVTGVRIASRDVGTVDVQVSGSRFERNSDGGGIGFYPEESQNSFAAARAAEEGAATLLVTDSSFDGNVSRQGGALDIAPGWGVDSSVVVARSTFAGNRAEAGGDEPALGGAISVWNSALTVENSTFNGNVVSGGGWWSGGGAIAVNQGTADLEHVTVAGNRAEDGARGGGIRGPLLVAFAAEGTPVTVTNSIVAGNTSERLEGFAGRRAAAVDPEDCDTAVTSGGGNLESGTSCDFDRASDKQNADPKVAALAANGGPTRTMAIGPGSPALDAAVASACLVTDQRRIARPAGACDSGAFEYAAPGTQPTTQQPTVKPAVAKSCLSERRFKIRLRVPRGEKVRKAIVKVNGKKVEVRRGKRLTAIVDLRGLPKKRYRVEIKLRLKGGKTVSGVRRYWTCTPAIRWTKPPKV
jgi:hypothetical protein